MTILKSPSGQWVNVRDGHKVRIYLRWGWVVWSPAEVWDLVAKSLRTVADATVEATEATRRLIGTWNERV